MRKESGKPEMLRTAALPEPTTSADAIDEKTLLRRGLDMMQHLTDSP